MACHLHNTYYVARSLTLLLHMQPWDYFHGTDSCMVEVMTPKLHNM